VKSDLAMLRTKYNASGSDTKVLCKVNLLRYYHNLQAEGLLVDFPRAKKFAMCVFSTPVTTVKVESLFSVMNYNKSGSRSGLHDATVAAIAQVQLLQPQLTGFGEGTQTMQIDTQKALDHRLPPSARRW
jgi:hypothetical protein